MQNVSQTFWYKYECGSVECFSLYTLDDVERRMLVVLNGEEAVNRNPGHNNNVSSHRGYQLGIISSCTITDVKVGMLCFVSNRIGDFHLGMTELSVAINLT